MAAGHTPATPAAVRNAGELRLNGAALGAAVAASARPTNCDLRLVWPSTRVGVAVR